MRKGGLVYFVILALSQPFRGNRYFIDAKLIKKNANGRQKSIRTILKINLTRLLQLPALPRPATLAARCRICLLCELP